MASGPTRSLEIMERQVDPGGVWLDAHQGAQEIAGKHGGGYEFDPDKTSRNSKVATGFGSDFDKVAPLLSTFSRKF